MPICPSAFRPPCWLRNPHLQTCWPAVAPRRQPAPLYERLELPDGDFLDLAWSHRPSSRTTEPLVVVMHGLEGSADSPYARGLLTALRRRGWHGVVMHFRGCSGVPNRLPRTYHSGETGDPSYVFRCLSKRHPAAPLAAVGYSLGGNVLMKYLGEVADATPLRAAVAVCPPLVLESCAERLEQGLSRLYQAYLLGRMKESLRRKRALMDLDPHLRLGPGGLKELNTFRRYDDAVTAPLHGFHGVDDYYAQCSGLPFLHRVSVPSLILHARDDPFMGPAVIPSARELSPAICYELSEHGGHVGFFGSESRKSPVYWLEERIPEFLANHLG